MAREMLHPYATQTDLMRHQRVEDGKVPVVGIHSRRIYWVEPDSPEAKEAVDMTPREPLPPKLQET